MSQVSTRRSSRGAATKGQRVASKAPCAPADRPLTPREVQFAEGLLTGLNQTAALLQAAPHLRGKWTQKSLRVRACRMAANPRVKAYVAAALERRAAQRRYKEDDLLTRMEKRGIIANCARSDDAEWSQRLSAIKIDNEMTGDAVVRVEEELSLSLILQHLTSAPALPTEEERAMLATPVRAEPMLEPPSQAMDAPVAYAGPIPGPFEADFQQIGDGAPEIEVPPAPHQPRLCVGGSPKTQNLTPTHTKIAGQAGKRFPADPVTVGRREYDEPMSA